MRLSAFSTALAALAALLAGAGVQPVAAAGAQSLYTSSVTYCSEAKAVLVNQFNIEYWRANGSVTFSISAASVQDNLDLTANIYANAYGMDLVNTTLDLCSYLQGVLCPLPTINFTGYGTYPIPTSYTKGIPSLAWTVPDIEAFARVTLTNSNTGEVAACLQATLSNGLSTQQTAVKWATAMFTLVAILVGVVFSTLRVASSPATYRWFDILFLFQAAAASGLLHLNYPSVYSNFVLNFSWALGLFHSGNIGDAINSLRGKTGGKLSDSAVQSVDYINRKLSPYNSLVRIDELFTTETPAVYMRSLVAAYPTNNATAGALVQRASIPTVISSSSSDLSTGIPVYVNSLDIATANSFLSVFIVYLIAIAVTLGALAIFFGVLLILELLSREARGHGWAGRLRRHYWSFLGGNMLRLCLIFLFPVLIFAFFQFTVGRSDSWLAILLAALCVAWTLLPLLVMFIITLVRAHRGTIYTDGINPLYTRYKWYHSVGMIYRQYRTKYHFWWFLPIVVAIFAEAAFIGFGQSNEWAQVIGLMVVELIVLVSCIGFRPHKDKKGDWLGAFLSFCRLAAFGLLIAFIPSVGVKAITRTIIGFVVIVLFGIPAVLLFFGFFFNLGYGLLWRRKKVRVEDGTEVRDLHRAASDDSSARQPAMVQTGGQGPLANLDDTPRGVLDDGPDNASMTTAGFAGVGLPARPGKAQDMYANTYRGEQGTQPEYQRYSNGYAANGGYDIDGARQSWHANQNSGQQFDVPYGHQQAGAPQAYYPQQTQHYGQQYDGAPDYHRRMTSAEV